MKKIKVSDATVVALDWLVAKCEGISVARHSTGAIYLIDTPWKDKSRVKWLTEYSPSKHWAQGGPIIEREGICVKPDLMVGTSETGPDVCTRIGWIAASHYNAQICRHRYEAKASTPLVAAMRCYVASKLGDEVEVPDELTQQFTP